VYKSARPGERILAAADKLFYEQGIRAVGVDTIAAQAGVSKRTLYNYYPTKDGLIAAYLTGRFRQIRRHLKHLSHHLIGDTSHGDGRHNRNFRMQGVHRMLLHAERLRFPHPDGGTVDVRAPVDCEFQKALDLFGWQAP
jgi:AcrR family transcriptional regulator